MPVESVLAIILLTPMADNAFRIIKSSAVLIKPTTTNRIPLLLVEFSFFVDIVFRFSYFCLMKMFN